MPEERNRAADVEVQLNELGQVAASVGHGVINAFSTIVSNTELLRMIGEKRGIGQSVELSEIIIRTALAASTVARRLIDFSRLATMPGEDPIRLEELARGVLKRRLEQSPARITGRSELEPLPEISGDRGQLEEMLGHLIDNAIESMPASGGTITLATLRDDRGWSLLEVRDTGKGMPREVSERAVEPFFTTKPERLGVGLSIANGIWRRHGGTLAVRSVEGSGTTVRLGIEPLPG